MPLIAGDIAPGGTMPALSFGRFHGLSRAHVLQGDNEYYGERRGDAGRYLADEI
jgi:hypothetical protein